MKDSVRQPGLLASTPVPAIQCSGSSGPADYTTRIPPPHTVRTMAKWYTSTLRSTFRSAKQCTSRHVLILVTKLNTIVSTFVSSSSDGALDMRGHISHAHRTSLIWKYGKWRELPSPDSGRHDFANIVCSNNELCSPSLFVYLVTLMLLFRDR
ncbi:hypothetical protein RRF57_011631 [Xylaria bambusicola]|uniref:Uncharacterized protein n=1 Tax=Xylaria bambusicola TaxID=326684 RepID=A0AAN7UX09_9PEZI